MIHRSKWMFESVPGGLNEVGGMPFPPAAATPRGAGARGRRRVRGPADSRSAATGGIPTEPRGVKARGPRARRPSVRPGAGGGAADAGSPHVPARRSSGSESDADEGPVHAHTSRRGDSQFDAWVPAPHSRGFSISRASLLRAARSLAGSRENSVMEVISVRLTASTTSVPARAAASWSRS